MVKRVPMDFPPMGKSLSRPDRAFRSPAIFLLYAVGGVSPISASRNFMSSQTGFFASGFRRR